MLLLLRTPSMRSSQNSTSETVRKGVRATLRALIWEVKGGQNGPKSTASVVRKATAQGPPTLFGQSLHEVG